MKWKEQLEQYEAQKNWKSAITIMLNTINNNPNDVEAYIRIIYLLHNILVEEDYPEIDHDYIVELLKYYFDNSFILFFDNSEYLFFIGKILYIAEWYFGINDDL